MKLAFITSLAPRTRPDTGFEIANAAIVEALRAAGHGVTVFAFARHDDELVSDPDLVLIDRITIENGAASGALKARWLAAAVARGLPFASAKLWLAGRNRLVEAVRARGPFDALVLNSVMMPGAFPELVGLAPAALVAHNLEHVSARQNAAHAASPLMKWLFAREARLLEGLERRLSAECRFIWCLAEEDRRALGAMLGTSFLDRSAMLPLVWTSAGRQLPPPDPGGHDASLIGTWTWEPNLIGLRWFLDEVAPLLPQGFRVSVAGRIPQGMRPPEGIGAVVSLVGRVPDATAFLAGGAVVALASRGGTGVQLKTIEALQLGLPAVATRLSLRGLGTPPANVRIADDAPGFARALVEHAAAARSGAAPRLDGALFMAAQAQALSGAVAAGLDAIRHG